jgi:hydrogenase expression/formation protein HypC
MGKVEFGGIVKDVCLALEPEAAAGDYVIVHAGFAISRVDEEEARQIFTYLEEMGEEPSEGEQSEGEQPEAAPE